MKRLNYGVLAPLLALALLLGGWWLVSAGALASDDDPPPDRQRDEVPGAPAISFIDSPSAECYRPVSGTDACYVNWQYLSVNAAPDYIVTMTVGIDNRLRAYFGGFFQTGMQVLPDLVMPGFHVACGVPGASGKPNLGNTYSYVIRARDSKGLTSANYGTVSCPADMVKIAGVSLSGATMGAVNTSYAFTASTQPITATLPLTYTWQATGQAPMTRSAGLTDAVSYSWTAPGPKTITTTVTNPAGSFTATLTIIIQKHRITLPLVLKN
jgi:hypothetical protein